MRRRRGREEVHLEEVEPGDRAPILRRYLEVAPGARPHLPVDRHAPLAEFERIADQYPVFWIIPAAPGAKRGDDRTTRPGCTPGTSSSRAGNDLLMSQDPRPSMLPLASAAFQLRAEVVSAAGGTAGGNGRHVPVGQFR